MDVLRGLCVAGMVLVNFPGDWVRRYHQLGHAEWDGATATDMIFPTFLLLSGFSMVYSFAARSARGESRGRLARHVVVRSVLLLVLGLLLNAIPDFQWHTLHVFGVLQRIALCTLVGGLFVLATRGRRAGTVNAWAVTGLMLLVLTAVWAAVRFVPVPGYGAWRFDHEDNLGAVVDRALFGTRHLSDWGGPARLWDADGLLSCITSIPNLLLGVLAAVWVRREEAAAQAAAGQATAGQAELGQIKPSQIKPGRTAAGMALLAGVLVGLALLLNPYLVINRKLWTGSFMLLSGGVSLGLFALFYVWLDGKGGFQAQARPRWWLVPALVYGSNAILGFALYSVLLSVHSLYRLPGAHMPAYWLPGPTYDHLAMWLGPYNMSLLYGLLAVALVLGLLWPFYSRRIFLKL